MNTLSFMFPIRIFLGEHGMSDKRMMYEELLNMPS